MFVKDLHLHAERTVLNLGVCVQINSYPVYSLKKIVTIFYFFLLSFFFFFFNTEKKNILKKKNITMATTTQQFLDSSMVWLAMYFFLNLGLTLYNKVIMATFQFHFPWALTAIHTFCGTVGSYIFWKLGVFKPAKLGDRENMVMLMFSVLYTINIAISNVSL